MEMRTRMLPKMLNSEIEAYLDRNDLIVVPLGILEMHGGFPVDCETVISEAFALKFAEAADGLVLPNLPYFYAGATTTGKGTVQVSIQGGIQYLGEIARSLLRQGFRRQVYLSMHSPTYLTASPMLRDLFEETGVSAVYIDILSQSMKGIDAVRQNINLFHEVTVGAYQILGRLEDVPLVTGFEHRKLPSVAAFQHLSNLCYQSGAVAYCFSDPADHMSTPDIPTEQVRQQFADAGVKMIEEMVASIDPVKTAEQLKELNQFNRQVMKQYPWIPAAWNTRDREE